MTGSMIEKTAAALLGAGSAEIPGSYTQTFILSGLGSMRKYPYHAETKIFLLGHISDAEILEVIFTPTPYLNGTIVTTPGSPKKVDDYELILGLEIPESAVRSRVKIFEEEVKDMVMNEPHIFAGPGSLSAGDANESIKYMDPLIATIKVIKFAGSTNYLGDAMLTLHMGPMASGAVNTSNHGYEQYMENERKHQEILRQQLQDLQSWGGRR